MDGMPSGETFTTRFALGARVWIVTGTSGQPIKLPCRFCRGAGHFRVEGAAGATGFADCPECRRRSGAGMDGVPSVVAVAHPPQWKASGPLTVGQIELRVQADDPDPDDYHVKREPRDERYMVEETGVGSGSVYEVADLFASQEEAEEEAERRTEAALSGDGWKPNRQEVRAAAGFLDHRDVYEHEPEHVEIAEQIVAASEDGVS